MSRRNLRARLEAQKRIKLAELRREVKYGKTTLLRAEKEWKKLCVQISLPKLREELILSWHSFEKLMDTKNFVISLYMDEVRDHEEQYMMNIRNHQDNIKQLMDQLARALNEIHQDNNTKLNNLIRKSLEEWDHNIMATDHAEAYLKIMSYALEMKRKKHEKQTKTEDFAKVNEAASRNAHDIQQITFYLELKFENTWSRIKNIQNDYFLHTQEHQRAHDAIRDVDDANNRTVRKELKKLVNLCELAKRLSTKYKELTGSIGKKLAYLETEKEYLNECFFAFRNKLKQDRDNDSIKRTLMTVEFVKTFDYLKSKLKKGNQMIETLRVSRRYETHPEKVLPYPYEIIEESKIKGLPIMTLFWQRLSEVQACRYALNEERLYLKRENKFLKQEIHKRCQCLDCPVLPPIPVRVGKIPYTEGKEMIRKQITQIGSKVKLVESDNNVVVNGNNREEMNKNGTPQRKNSSETQIKLTK